MKTSSIIIGLFFLIISSASVTFAQQQFIQTVTRENINCNATCSVLDIAELNGNPGAVIFVTPVDAVGSRLAHPIAAYYMYLKKWSIFNVDATAFTEGAKFKVEYYTKPGSDQFLYVVPAGGSSCVDRAGLNGNPNAQVRLFQTGSPSQRGLFNRNDAKAEYNPAVLKWCIANINGSIVPAESAYNISFASGGNGPWQRPNGGEEIKPALRIPELTIKPTANSSSDTACNCPIPTSLPPSGAAGGDLGGNYPAPTVQKILGRPLASRPPVLGEFLRWDGSQWTPSVLSMMIGGQEYVIDKPIGPSTFGDVSGDLSGNFAAPTVQKLQGKSIKQHTCGRTGS